MYSYQNSSKSDDISSLSQVEKQYEEEKETSTNSEKSVLQNSNVYYCEPTMLHQRSCFKSQSVSHILAKVFRDMFSYDVMKCDMIDNLYKSCAPGKMTSDDYQRQYVNALRNIQETHEKRMAEADLIERHYLEAQTLAYTEEKCQEYAIINNEQFDPNIYHPPVPSHFKKHCDKELLHKHDLICAQDFMTSDEPSIKFPAISSSGNLLSVEGLDKTNKKQLLIRSTTSTLRQKLKSEKIRNRKHNLTSAIDTFNKTTFLKNMKSLISMDSSKIFSVIPNEIIFTNYEIGKIYQMSLELKNVSSSLKFLRIIPPTTHNFTINFGDFPSDKGTIAPGLSCVYGIQFCADLLIDYEDFVIVEPEASKIIKIPIKARRLPPNLNLLDNIDIGDCLNNTKKNIQLKITNFGGDGKFTIIPSNNWSTTEYNDVIIDNRVKLGECIEVLPANFELKSNTWIMFNIVFVPTVVGSYEETFVLVCDNCSTRHFTINGKSRENELVLESEDLCNYKIGEIPDTNAQFLIRFDPVKVNAISEKCFSINNCIDVEIDYYWEIVKPHKAKKAFEDEVHIDKLPSKRFQDFDTSFEITPAKGKFEASNSCKFSLKFKPHKKDEYCNLLCLILKYTKYLNDGTTCEEEETKLAIELIGEATDAKIFIEPNIFVIQKLIPLYSYEERCFQVKNESNFEITYEWENKRFPFILFVEPKSGKIDGNSTSNFVVNISSGKTLKTNETLLCNIDNGMISLAIYVLVEFQGPELMLCQPDVDFGSLEIGATYIAPFVFKNISSIPANWNVNLIKESNSDLSNFEMILNGDIGAQETLSLKIKYTPTELGLFNYYMNLSAIEGNEILFSMNGFVQKFTCKIVPDIISINSYVNVKNDFEINIFNPSQFSTAFEFIQPQDDEIGKIRIHPIAGTLNGKEQIKISASFTGSIIGIFNSCLFCSFQNQDSLEICLNIIINESIHFTTSLVPFPTQCDSNEMIMDYGYENEVGTILKYYLHIQNYSPLPIPFDAYVEFLKAPNTCCPTPPQNKIPKNNLGRKYLLKKTVILSERENKTEKQALFDLSRKALSGGKGAAFMVTPSNGILNPSCTTTIQIVAFTDTWGTYFDNLICQVGDLFPKNIPIKITVHGCPLYFQMFEPKNSPNPVLFRFGTHLLGSPTITKSICLVNNSAIDVKLNWQLFRLFEFDDQLLDLITTYSGFLEDETNTVDNEDNINCEKIISFKLRDHIGVKAELNQPYDIQPINPTIKAHSTIDISLSFYPPKTLCDSLANFHYTAFTYISIHKEDELNENFCHRKQKYELAPFIFQILAEVVKPILTVEYHQGKEFEFKCTAGDLIDINFYDKLKDYHWIFAGGKLSNPLNCDLVFKISVKEPFYLVEFNPITKEFVSNDLITNSIHLRPMETVQVKLAFLLKPNLVLKVDKMQELNAVEELTPPTRILNFNENMIIHFLDKKSKEPLGIESFVLNMHAEIIMPRFELSLNIVDFGPTILFDRNQLEIVITNPTESKTYWYLIPEANDNDCFTISPTCGYLENYKAAPINSMSITISFTPKKLDMFECVYLFRGILDEPPQHLLLRGAGFLDSWKT